MAEALDLVPDQSREEAPPLDLVPVEPDTSAMKAFVKENTAKARAERQPVDTSIKPVEAETWEDALAAGWGMSVTGLMGQGRNPDIVLSEDAGTVMEVASQIGTLAGDAPAMVTGGIVGGFAGSYVPAIGNVVGAYAGANALPAAMRKIMMDHYERGDIQTKEEFWNRLSSTTWETIKAGTVGAATGRVGELVGPAAGGLARTASEIATMVSLGSALEGHMPDASDFINAGIVVGGIAGSVKVAGKLRGMYAKQGVLPADAVEQINNNVELRQEVLAEPK